MLQIYSNITSHMTKIRIRMSIDLAHNHALSEDQLKALKPSIERAVAGSLPTEISVDTVKVTRINEAKAQEVAE